MGFLGIRRSPVKHADPRVRERAVRDLPVAEQGTLAEVALADADPAVRIAAAAKVREPDLLLTLARHKDAAVAKLGRDRLASIATATIKTRPLAAAEPLLAEVHEASALVEIALQADHQAVREAACERFLGFDDPGDKFLGTLAIQEASGVFGRRAVPRIGKRAVLKDVGKNAKDPGVRELARGRLEALAAEARKPSAEKQRRARARRLEELCERARILAVSERWDAAEAELEDLDRRRAAVLAEYGEVPEDDACAEAAAALARARDTFEARRDQAAEQARHAADKRALLARVPAAEDDAEAWAAWRAEWDAIGDAGAAEAELIRRRRAAEAADVDAADAEPAAADHPDVAGAGDVAAPAPLESAQQTVLDELMAEAATLAASDDWRAADQRFKELDKLWRVELGALGSGDPRRVAFLEHYTTFKDRRRADRERRAERRAERLATMRELLAAAEELAARSPGAEDLDAHFATLKDLQARWRGVGGVGTPEASELRSAFREACDQAFLPIKEMHEARDLERSNNVPKAEDLIAAATALHDETDLETAYHAVKRIQADWKALGQVPRERRDELWQRFKAACDVVYANLQPLFAARDREREANLAHKRTLVEELRAAIEAPRVGMPGSKADEDALAERAATVKRIQEDWKAIGPVPREHDRELWGDCKALLDRFYADRREQFKQRDQERVENLTHKLALCAAADELAQDVQRFASGHKLGNKAEPDFLRAVKDLQRRWREIGHVPRDRYPEVRDRFQAACDIVYQALEPWFARQDAERAANLERKRALLAELEELLEEERPDWFKDEARRIQQAWRDAGQVPRSEMAINDRFQEACDRIFNR